MKTFVILYAAFNSNYSVPQKVGWFETQAVCLVAADYAREHQVGDHSIQYTCVEYLDNMDGLFK